MNFNLHDLLLLAPEGFLLGATCAILFIDLFLKPSQRALTHWLSIAALLGALAIVLRLSGPAATAFDGAYIHDIEADVLKVFIKKPQYVSARDPETVARHLLPYVIAGLTESVSNHL